MYKVLFPGTLQQLLVRQKSKRVWVYSRRPGQGHTGQCMDPERVR